MNRMFSPSFSILILLFASWNLSIGDTIESDQRLNIVPFGEVQSWDSSGKDYGVVWEDPRDVFHANVTFQSSDSLPDVNSIQIQYWQSQWPERRIPRDQPSGAGSSGWLDIGDWFQGVWKTADTVTSWQNNTLSFAFKPLNESEFPQLNDFPAEYRTTMKLRLVSSQPLPKIQSFQVYTDSDMKTMEADILWGGNAERSQNWDGRLEIFNGFIQSIEPVSKESKVSIQPENSWKSDVQQNMDGIHLHLLHAIPQSPNSFDNTIVTIRSQQESFSFYPSDLQKWGHIFLPDYGVLIRKADRDITYAEALENWKRNTEKDLYSRVNSMPEQTFTQAWNDTPAKDPHYIPLSFEGGRQHFRLDEHGNVTCINNWIKRIPGKDTEHCLWDGDSIEYRFGFPDNRLVDRTLLDGYLPIVISQWNDQGYTYKQTAFVMPLNGIPNAGGRIWADDTLVCMMRIEIENKNNSVIDGATAHLRLSVKHGDSLDFLSMENSWIFATEKDEKRLRMAILSPQKQYLPFILDTEKELAFQERLHGDHSSVRFDIAIPYITLTEEKDYAQLQKLDFGRSKHEIAKYWEDRLKQTTRIKTPEPMINDFYNADLAHLLINTEREVGISDCYMAKVGTAYYGVYSNESCMMISDLDRRGLHTRAEQAIDTWLKYQGTVALPGDYSTQEGEFYGAGGYEDGGYNQHHGWILWCMGEHYWYSRNRIWLQNAAPQIVKACEWVIHERQRTLDIASQSPLRAIERGLLPPGRLEDIGDWRSWLSTNVFTWWGMQNVAAALLDIGHPDGARLLSETEAYKQDILSAFTEAMHRSPVVRLRDGRWIPHIPSDAHRRGRSFGWITETLEGAIHLIRTGAIEPSSRLATWIIQDFEDNLYLSEQYGYKLPESEFERYWFSRGGISMQANLLHNPIPYLLRDEPKHFLRAYFNAFAVSYFPDTRMMTEHALPNIGDWRGDHFKSSDESNSTYYLRLMFVEEHGDELWYGAAIPRYWLTPENEIGIDNASTYFGTTSMTMRGGTNTLRMTIEPPLRNPPKLIRARFRHPEGKRMIRCHINGQLTTQFDPEKEWVVVPNCTEKTEIIATYQ